MEGVCRLLCDNGDAVVCDVCRGELLQIGVSEACEGRDAEEVSCFLKVGVWEFGIEDGHQLVPLKEDDLLGHRLEGGSVVQRYSIAGVAVSVRVSEYGLYALHVSNDGGVIELAV